MNEVVELTKKLVALPTVTGKIQPAHTDVVVNMLKSYGYEVHQQGEHLLATIGSGSNHLAFVSHYDVVPAGDGWNTDPFTPTEEHGILYGRGVSDMKSGLAVHIATGKQLANLDARVTLFIAADEETKSEGMPSLLTLCSNIIKDPISYAIGGEPTSKGMSGNYVKMGRRGVVQGDVKFYGKQGHAAYTKDAKNIIHDLGKIVAAFKSPIDKGNKDFPPSTCSVTGIEAGIGVYNVIPGTLTVKFDTRLSSRETTPEAYIKQLSTKLMKKKLRFDIDVKKQTAPYHSKDKSLRSIAEKSIQSITGRKPEFSTDGGMSDIRFFAQNGIPCLEVGVPNGKIHDVDEYVSIEEIERLEKIYLMLGKSLIF